MRGWRCFRDGGVGRSGGCWGGRVCRGGGGRGRRIEMCRGWVCTAVDYVVVVVDDDHHDDDHDDDHDSVLLVG